MTRRAGPARAATSASDDLLRMYARQFSELLHKGKRERCRAELQKRPDLFAALTPNDRVYYAMQEMTLAELQVAVQAGLIEAKAHLGTNVDLMCTAAARERLDVMQWLWSERATFGYELAALSHALCQACESGRVEAARWLLDIGVPAAAPAVFDAGGCISDDVPLVDAADYGDVELIELLLERGADPNGRNFMGHLPIQMAVKHGKKAIQPLLRAGADVELRYEDDDLGVLAFAIASHTEGGDEAFGYFLDLGVDARNHSDALLVAAEEGSYPYVKTMLDLGVNVNWQGRKSHVSALMLACGKQNVRVVELLLQRGADPNLTSGDGRTALVWAAKGGNLKMIDLLIAAGASPASVQGSKSFWQLIAGQTPEIKRHIRAQLLARSVEDAMAGPADMSPAPSRPGGMSPL